jgi:hypothetical protein
MVLILPLLIVGCTQSPLTDAQLQGEAQQAVDRALGTQASFSLMEAVATHHIACGHASARSPVGSPIERDFVYRGRELILDGSQDFDQAAVECDRAAGEGSAAPLGS